MSQEEHDQEHADLTTREALHRMNVLQKARETLDGLEDDDAEHRAETRQHLIEQAEHYQRMANGITALVQDDFKKYAD